MDVTAYEQPYRHWVVEEWFDPERDTEFKHYYADLKQAYERLPPASWPGWIRYDNQCECRKRTCNDREALREQGASVDGPLSDLMAFPGSGIRRQVFDLNYETKPDATLHGGGVHVTDPGGWLSPHLDYALHPHLAGWERRLNLVLFLNPVWREEWGGAFELYDDRGEEVITRVYPKFNRAVVWEPGDTAFHGTQKVAEDAPPRATLAVYYLAPARPGVTRKRALFVPRRSTC